MIRNQEITIIDLNNVRRKEVASKFQNLGARVLRRVDLPKNVDIRREYKIEIEHGKNQISPYIVRYVMQNKDCRSAYLRNATARDYE